LELVQEQPARYGIDLSHGFDLGWRPLPFLNFGYRIDVNRDFDEDRECFGREAFFSTRCGGPFAGALIFAWDDARQGSGGYLSPTGGGYVDTTRYGNVYGVLARERNRSQSFNTDFTAN